MSGGGGTPSVGDSEERAVCDFIIDPSAPIPAAIAASYGVVPEEGSTELRPVPPGPATQRVRRKARKREGEGEGEGDAPPSRKRKVPQGKEGAPSRALRPIGRAGRAAERAAFH